MVHRKHKITQIMLEDKKSILGTNGDTEEENSSYRISRE